MIASLTIAGTHGLKRRSPVEIPHSSFCSQSELTQRQRSWLLTYPWRFRTIRGKVRSMFWWVLPLVYHCFELLTVHNRSKNCKVRFLDITWWLVPFICRISGDTKTFQPFLSSIPASFFLPTSAESEGFVATPASRIIFARICRITYWHIEMQARRCGDFSVLPTIAFTCFPYQWSQNARLTWYKKKPELFHNFSFFSSYLKQGARCKRCILSIYFVFHSMTAYPPFVWTTQNWEKNLPKVSKYPHLELKHRTT